MELRQLKYLLAAVECGSLGRAALQLGMATSALSQQISRLESELSARLLVRGASGVVPHNTLAIVFGAASLFSVVALAIGVTRFWRQVSEPGKPVPLTNAVGEAAKSALTLQYLGGGHGDGCNNEDDAFTLWRRRFHHYTFYGFMLCFASTSVATLYHYS